MVRSQGRGRLKAMDWQRLVNWVQIRLERSNPVPQRLKVLHTVWGAVLVAVTVIMISGFIWYPLVRSGAGDLVADRVFSVVCEAFFWVYVGTLVARPLFRRFS